MLKRIHKQKMAKESMLESNCSIYLIFVGFYVNEKFNDNVVLL